MRDASEYLAKAAEFEKLAAITGHPQLRLLYSQLAREYTDMAAAVERINAKLQAITVSHSPKVQDDAQNE